MSRNSKSLVKVSNLDEFENMILEGSVIVNISASWCGACRFFESVLTRIAKEYSDIKFLKIDLDEAEETMPDVIEHVCNIPHFDLYHDGIKVGEYSGSKADQLKIVIEQLKSKTINENEVDSSLSFDNSNGAPSGEDEKKDQTHLSQNNNEEFKDYQNLEKINSPEAEEIKNDEFSNDQTESRLNGSDFTKLDSDLEQKNESSNALNKEINKPLEVIPDSKFVVNISDTEQYKELISDGVSLVNIHDPSCPLSIYISTHFNQLADQNPEIKFLKIHVKHVEEKMFPELEHISATPHFDLYKNGKKIEQYCGSDELKLNEAVILLKSLLLSKSDDEGKIAEIPSDDSVTNEKEQKSENMKLINSSEEFKETTLVGASLVHYSADWCRPSLSIQPILENLAIQNTNINKF
ncbi:thioredoxin domain-containing 2 [Brachionus plicatilis]|uniref:Thioredoxin domain-containing 2 n=1 Tax=Brachionus plicatilis TaxID=10195 RepID=A0A3M7R0U0_BRAPC|nr:thioredoxin domain-containing 2 [Brachionus plicatilis]